MVEDLSSTNEMTANLQSRPSSHWIEMVWGWMLHIEKDAESWRDVGIFSKTQPRPDKCSNGGYRWKEKMRNISIAYEFSLKNDRSIFNFVALAKILIHKRKNRFFFIIGIIKYAKIPTKISNQHNESALLDVSNESHYYGYGSRGLKCNQWSAINGNEPHDDSRFDTDNDLLNIFKMLSPAT